MRNKDNTMCILILVLSSLSGIIKAQQSERPNIIFILTDDHRSDALGYAGNNIIMTPQLDKLAKEGAYFRNAFVTTPICAASRASILTGLYERTHGYTFLTGDLKDQYVKRSYPVLLKRNGYYTGFFGKFGVEYDHPEKLFDVADLYDRMGKFKDRRGYFYKTIDGDTVHLTKYTGYQAREFIKNAPRDRPFCLSLSFSAPHAHDPAPDQYFWQTKSDKRYADITIPAPIMTDDRYFTALPMEVREGFNRVRWHWRYDTPEKYQQSVKGYYRMITEIDDEIGLIREELKRSGLDHNTIIIFMGDNGLFLGERQLAGKWLMYDVSLRVPMIIYDPRVGNHVYIDDMVLNIDIPKTILKYAGIEPPAQYQGLSLDYVVAGNKKAVKRGAVLFEHLWDFPPIPSSEGVRTERWKYMRYRLIQADEELYDLRNDPMEKVNLAKDSRYQNVLKKLRNATDSRIKQYQTKS